MLTETLQVEVLHKFVMGELTQLPLERFSEPWLQFAWELNDTPLENRIEQVKDIGRKIAIQSEKTRNLSQVILNYQYTPQEYKLFDEENLGRVEFLWRNWLLKNYINMFVAESGYGKTFIALDIARRIAMNEAMPDGSKPNIRSGKTIWVDAENMGQIAKNRIEAWKNAGMWDGSGIYRYYPDSRKGYIDFAEQEERDHLTTWCYDIKPDYVILDSYNSALWKGVYKEDAQKLLGFFHSLAIAENFALLIIHHPRKSKTPQKQSEAMHTDDIANTKYLVQYSRIVWTIHKESERSDDMLLKVINTNVEKPEPLVVQHKTIPNGIAIEYEQYQSKQRKSHVEECEAYIIEILDDEEMSHRQIRKACQEEGYGDHTARKAIKRLVEAGKLSNTVGEGKRGNKLKVSVSDESQ